MLVGYDPFLLRPVRSVEYLEHVVGHAGGDVCLERRSTSGSHWRRVFGDDPRLDERSVFLFERRVVNRSPLRVWIARHPCGISPQLGGFLCAFKWRVVG